jgi:hypothetical protein
LGTETSGFVAFWEQRDAILTSAQPVKDGALTQAVEYIRQLLAQWDEARKENEVLATWQCPFQDGKKGLTSDEHGTQFCAMEERVKELEEGLVNIKNNSLQQWARDEAAKLLEPKP